MEWCLLSTVRLPVCLGFVFFVVEWVELLLFVFGFVVSVDVAVRLELFSPPPSRAELVCTLQLELKIDFPSYHHGVPFYHNAFRQKENYLASNGTYSLVYVYLR